MNRKQRRSLTAAGYFANHNGVNHAELTKAAFERLTGFLEGHGNSLDSNHRSALYALVGAMTRMAQGKLTGRWAFGLPTGMGKSSAIVAWCASLNALGIDHVSVAVAASKVEALCDMKRALIAQGVPAEKIGLIHSYNFDPSKVNPGQPMPTGYASEPSEGDGRQFMLVTHARVRGCDLARFNTFRGKPRDVLIYDESLMVSDAFGLPVRNLKAAVGFLQGMHDGSHAHAPLISFLSDCRMTIETELQRQRASGAGEGVIRLPSAPAEQLVAFKSLLGTHPAVDAAHQLLEIAHQDVRVILTGQGGVVSYEISVPRELSNVLVLDASYPIRKLVHLDSSIRDAERCLPEMARLDVPLSQLKRFDRVSIRQMFSGGGRDTMRQDFQKPEDQRRVSKDVVSVVNQIPTNEAVLIFTYLTRPTERVSYRDILLRDLDRAGIDTSASVMVNGVQRPRISVLTWGQETSLNDYAHCANVILVGVLQRSPVDLAASYVGQVDDLSAAVPHATIKALQTSESAHLIYQALSRGSCRVIDQGQAVPMKAWLIHRDQSVRGELQRVMPGARWETWEATEGAPSAGAIARATARVVDFLGQLPADVSKLSSRQLRRDAGLLDIPARTFTEARGRALKLAPWRMDGQSLVRMFG